MRHDMASDAGSDPRPGRAWPPSWTCSAWRSPSGTAARLRLRRAAPWCRGGRAGAAVRTAAVLGRAGDGARCWCRATRPPPRACSRTWSPGAARRPLRPRRGSRSATGGCAARLDFVLDGHSADLFLVPVTGAGRHRAVRLPALGRGAQRPGPGAGPDPAARRLELTDAAAEPVGAPGGAGPVLDACWTSAVRRWPPSRSADRRARAGAPPCPTCGNGSSSAGRSARSRRSSTGWPTCWSSWRRRGRPRRTPRAAAATSRATRAARRAADRRGGRQGLLGRAAELAVAEFVQLHGGIGFTWEHPAHLYVRRARSTEVLFGTAAAQRRRIAALLALPGAG